jgi:uncharacterized cupin superfamily protein
MHATSTIDYALILEGELWLELDDGKTVHFCAGDIVVQQATRHGWRNKGQRPATARNLTTTHETESCDPDKPSFVHTRRRTHLRTASLPHHPKGHELCAQP